MSEIIEGVETKSEIKCPFCNGNVEIREYGYGLYRGYCMNGCFTSKSDHNPKVVEANLRKRKPMERIVKNLEHLCEQTYYKSVDGDFYAGARNNAYHNAIQVVKKEGGIE